MYLPVILLTSILPVVLVHGQCPPSGCTVCNDVTAVCEGKVCPRSLATDKLNKLVLIGGHCDEFRTGILKSQLDMLPELQSLTLTLCKIGHFWGSPFQNNTKLTELALHNNEFQSIKHDTFQGLKHLLILNLLRNKINNIDDNAFSDLTALTSLNLRSNKLQSLNEGTTRGLTSVKDMDFSYNEISQVQENSLHPATALETINLSNNQLSSIPDDFFGNAVHLQTVDLNTNLVSSVGDLAFSGTSLDRLDLSTNSMTSIPNFKPCKSAPKTLYLNNNKISRVKANDFAGMKITCLDLSVNPLALIEEGSFTGCEVSELNLTSTKLTSLPESMSSMIQAGTVLRLDSRNWRCECDQLWLGRFLLTSSESRGPICGHQTYAGKALIDTVKDLEADCFTTSTSPTKLSSQTTSTTRPMLSGFEVPSALSTSIRPTTKLQSTSHWTGITDSTTTQYLHRSATSASKNTPTQESHAPMIAGIICSVLLVGAVVTGLLLWKMKNKVKPSLSPDKSTDIPSTNNTSLPDPLTQTSSSGQAPQSTSCYHGQVNGPSQVKFLGYQ